MKRAVLTVVLSLAVVSAGVLGYRQIAQAFSCGAATCGYFTSSTKGSAWYDVLPQPALVNVWNANQFINTISGLLYSGNAQQRMGAAFIVDNMLKYKGKVADNVGGGVAAGEAYAQNVANFNAWKGLVNGYAVNSCATLNSTATCVGKSFGINWGYIPTKAAFCSGRTDSGYDNNGAPNFTGVNDDILYRTPALGTGSCDFEYANSMPELHIYWPGGQFNIGKHCGNLQDTENAIPPPNNPPTGTIVLDCDATNAEWKATVNFSDADGATTGYITAGAWQSGTVNSGPASQITIPQSDAGPYGATTVQLYVRDVGPLGSGNYSIVDSAVTVPPCIALSCGSLSVVSVDPVDPYMKFALTATISDNGSSPPPGNPSIMLTITPRAGETYNFVGSQASTWSAGVSTATFNNLGPTNKAGIYDATWTMGSQSCLGTFQIVYLPYVNVYGGDVMIGASPSYNGGVTGCSTNTVAGAFGWNNHGPGFGYSGAGAQFAVQALGAITGFGSALNASNKEPDGLSFANTYAVNGSAKDNPASGLYGGYYGDASGNWTGSCDFTSDLKSSPLPGATVTSAITSLVMPLKDGTQTVEYASGDVYVSKDIQYTTSGWGTASDIPSFKLVVVGGDIYIDNDVTQLDGLYVAESSGGVGGNIYTCASGLGTAVTPATAGYYNTCHHQLLVNGAFVAKQVQFGRTYGSVGQAATTPDTLAINNDAEIFNYTPELWLPRNNTTPSSGYAAIIGLPPVL